MSAGRIQRRSLGLDYSVLSTSVPNPDCNSSPEDAQARCGRQTGGVPSKAVVSTGIHLPTQKQRTLFFVRAPSRKLSFQANVY